MDTKEIVEKYFECINSREWETWVTLFHDHVVMDEALSGHMEGIQAVKDSANGIQQGFSKFENHIREMVVEGNSAMVVCRIEAKTSADVPLESTGANFYRVENGKILYMASFHDREPFLKAFSVPQSEEKQVVMKFFEAVGKGDVQGIKQVLADDVEFFIDVDPSIMPYGGRSQGIDAALAVLTGSSGSVENLKVSIKWMVSEDEKVVVLINEKAIVANTGRSYDVDSVHIYTVKDGKIFRFENHFNPLPMLKASLGDIRFVESPKKYNVVKEEWTFYEGETYNHTEIFSYEYDENGRRTRGEFRNLLRDLRYIMSFQYDEAGRATGETWVNSADNKDVYTITFDYDEANDRIRGGKAVGQNSWKFTYEYDKYGKKSRMTNEFTNGISWVFNYYHDEEGRCILGEGVASYGRRCSITYKYSDSAE